jgi:neutral ceramidase
VELNASMEELVLGVRRPSPEEVRAAREMLAPVSAGGQYRDRRHIYARETLYLAGYSEAVPAPVQALRIGELGIATFPGEAFVELGLEVKQKSPFKRTFLMELANDYRGYLPTVEGHELGGYETWRAKSSFLEKDAAPKMVASALRQLSKLA